MAWSKADAMSGFAAGGAPVAGTVGVAGTPAPGRRYMLSMVGRRACPNGVDKKSVGKSKLPSDADLKFNVSGKNL